METPCHRRAFEEVHVPGAPAPKRSCGRRAEQLLKKGFSEPLEKALQKLRADHGAEPRIDINKAVQLALLRIQIEIGRGYTHDCVKFATRCILIDEAFKDCDGTIKRPLPDDLPPYVAVLTSLLLEAANEEARERGLHFLKLDSASRRVLFPIVDQ